jgi:hypothetical protein
LRTHAFAKLKYDRERFQKLTKQPTVESDDDEPPIPSIPVSQVPVGPVKDPTPPVNAPTPSIFKDESLPSPLFEEDDEGDNTGEHTVDGSEQGHIDEDGGEGRDGYIDDEDIYRVSDGEQEVRRVPQDEQSDLGYQEEYPGAQESQDDDEISQLATQLENQTWISYPGLALQSLGGDLDDSVATDPDEPVPLDISNNYILLSNLVQSLI